MIKNVIFDIGGVIVKFKKETYLDPLGLDEATKNYLIDEILFTDDWFQLSIGKMTDEQFLSNVQKNHTDYFELTKSVFEIDTLKKLLPVYSQTIELIKKIKEKGYHLFIISDIEESNIRYIESEIPNLHELFEDVIYSCRVGLVKKHGEVFDLAINRFNVVPEESIFIDDTQINLDQASKRGINTFRFTDPDIHVAELESMLLK